MYSVSVLITLSRCASIAFSPAQNLRNHGWKFTDWVAKLRREMRIVLSSCQRIDDSPQPRERRCRSRTELF